MATGLRAKASRAGGPGRPGRPLRLLPGATWLLAAAAATSLIVIPGGSPAPPPRRTVVASLPYWNIGSGAAVVLAHRRDFTEVSPWMYGLDARGRIGTQYTAGQAPTVEAAIARLRSAGLAIVPTLANITAGRWSYRPAAAVLHDRVRMRQQVAPIRWVRSVLRYARSQIPAGKLILGLPLYGYDWSGGHATALSWLRAFQLSRRYHARPRYSAASQEPWFTYTAAGRRHVVWFENQASSRAKLSAAQGAGIRGVFFWMFGYEDTGTWAALHQVLPAGHPAATGGGGR